MSFFNSRVSLKRRLQLQPVQNTNRLDAPRCRDACFPQQGRNRLLVKSFKEEAVVDSPASKAAHPLTQPSADTLDGLLDLSRVQSNSEASTSDSTSEGLYESNAVQKVVKPQAESHKESDPVTAEINDCEEIEDIIEIVEEEAEAVNASCIATALFKCVNLAKKKAGRPGKEARRELARVGKSKAFETLLIWIQKKAEDMLAKDLAICLWSLATMNIKQIRVLRLLQKHIELQADEMNAHDLAMTAWAFASLKHHPGALLDLLADTAVPKLATFESQGLSMMLWAYAKLDHMPPAEFSGGVLMLLNEKLEEFSPQSIANIVYALGKLQRYPRPLVCERVEDLVARDPSRFKDIELANILYGYVKSRYQPAKLVSIMEDRIEEQQLEQQTLTVAWATLIWASGALGLPLKRQTLAALGESGLDKQLTYEPLSLCNMAWGLAMLGEVQHPAFERTVHAIVDSHRQRTLEPRLMRQLFQAITAARTLGVDIKVPADLESTAHKWWRRATLGMPISIANENVAKAVRKLGLKVEVQKDAGYGLPHVNVAIFKEDGSKLALQISNPNEYSANTGKPLGRALAAQRLLEAAGWEVALLETASLPNFTNEPAVIRRIGEFLSGFGIATDWQATSASAPRPLPVGLRGGRARVMGLPRYVRTPRPSTDSRAAAPPQIHINGVAEQTIIPAAGGQQAPGETLAAQEANIREERVVLGSEGLNSQNDSLDKALVARSQDDESARGHAHSSSAEANPDKPAQTAAGMRQLEETEQTSGAANGSVDSTDSTQSAARGVALAGRNKAMARLETTAAEKVRQLAPSVEDDLSPEEKERREERTKECKAEVARNLRGDFMDDWINLSEWKTLKKVIPSK